MPSKYMVIEALRSFDGDRFPVNERELRVIRFGYEDPDFVPTVVAKARSFDSIHWGGAVVFSDAYRVIFDGPGPIPAEITARLPKSTQSANNRPKTPYSEKYCTEIRGKCAHSQRSGR